MQANALLSALSASDRHPLLPYLQPITLSLGQVLLQSHKRIDRAYFLTSAVVSLVYTTESGFTAEMALIANDGIVGMSIFRGGDSICNQTVVAVTGQALKILANHGVSYAVTIIG